MRKRPLCFFCMIMVLIMWILRTSGEDAISSDVLYPVKEKIVVYGTIYRCEQDEKKQILYLDQAILSVNSQKQKINHIQIKYESETQDYQVSDFVCVTGQLQKMKQSSNPGQFDAHSYYQTQKVGYIMWDPQIELLKRPTFSFFRILDTLQKRFAGQYDAILPNQYGALLKGITLGVKNDLSDETRLLFQRGGISHILAISALHLQLLGSSLYHLLRKCRMPIWAAAVLSGTVMISYGILTGANVATLRALIMYLLNIGADVTGRTYDGMTGMAVAAVVLVAGNPEYLLYGGFWLSFFAVCSFMIFKEKKRFAGGILLYVFMAPVMLICFYELSPYSVFLNLLVVPTVGIVLLSGFAGCIGSMFHLLLGKILVFPAVFLLYLYRVLCEISQQLPGNTLIIGRPSWLQVLFYYAMMALALYLFRKYRLKKGRVLALLLMLPACLVLIWNKVDGIQITMLDVGQGDCIVIRTETNHTYLIDGGSTTENSVGNYRIVPYLKYSGVGHVDAIFLTHADEDHVNGIRELLEMIVTGKTTISVGRLILPHWKYITAFSEIIDLAALCKIEVYIMKKGSSLTDGEMVLTCLHPDGRDYMENENEGSLVLDLDYKGFSMIFTGDLEGDGEKELLGTFGMADILKVAHHGSRYSTSEAFLKEIKPDICLISCGERNSYGHPHEELLERLEVSGAVVFETQKYGALTIRTDGEKIDLKTYKQYNSSEAAR